MIKHWSSTGFMALSLAACGGGGSGSAGPAPVISAVQTTPTPIPTTAASALQLFPVATAVASPPPGVLGVQDISMQFTVAGATQYILAVEPGFHGTFTARPTAACSVAPGVSNSITSPVTVNAVGGSTGPQAVFAIAAAAAGTCAIKFNDGTTTNSAEVLVTVTQSVGTVN